MISWVYWGSNEGWSDSNRVCLIGTDFWIFSSAIYDSPFDSIGTYGATVADLNNDEYVVIHLSTSINGDGWVDVIFGEKAPFSDWRNGRITTSTNYGILMGMGNIYWNIGPPAFFYTSIKTNLYSVKASRNLSVQIFGNFYFLLPPKPSTIFTSTLSLVQTFVNFPFLYGQLPNSLRSFHKLCGYIKILN